MSPRYKVAVVDRFIRELRLNSRNPRIHSRKQIRQIARSIETFGFNTPVLIDSNDNVVAGHGRILACTLLGWTEVPTIRLEHLSEAQAKAFMIADNRLTEVATWDDRLLAEQLEELSKVELDFSLEVTGFDMGEIDLRIESLAADDDQEDSADALPPTKKQVPVSQPGDLWLLGRHRVVCGNALESDAYKTLMQNKLAAMAFADVPYNVPIDGNVGGLGAIHHREFTMAAGEMSEAEFSEFLATALALHADHSAAGALHFICMDWRHLGELLAAGKKIYSELKNIAVWVKDNAGMGSLYRSQHELILIFKHGRDRHRNNVQLGQYGRNRTNVWRYPCANSFSRSGDEGNLLAIHPTVKPVALVADAILDCTARGEIVLDGFLGSGTTVIAAERTGRRCYGLEIDPLYADTIMRRWQAFTGGQARHGKSGRTFNELEREVVEEHHGE